LPPTPLAAYLFLAKNIGGYDAIRRRDDGILVSGATIITALATILLVVVTHRLSVATRRFADISREMNALATSTARSETDAMLIGAVNAVNAIVLGDDRNLRAADKLIAREGPRHLRRVST